METSTLAVPKMNLHSTLRRNFSRKQKVIFSQWLMFYRFLNSLQQNSSYSNKIGGCLIEGALILPHKNFEKKSPQKEDMYKVLEPLMEEL